MPRIGKTNLNWKRRPDFNYSAPPHLSYCENVIPTLGGKHTFDILARNGPARKKQKFKHGYNPVAIFRKLVFVALSPQRGRKKWQWHPHAARGSQKIWSARKAGVTFPIFTTPYAWERHVQDGCPQGTNANQTKVRRQKRQYFIKGVAETEDT